MWARRAPVIGGTPVIAIAAVFVLVAGLVHQRPAGPAHPVRPAILRLVTGVPASVFDSVGAAAGRALAPLPAGTAGLRSDGLPRIVYVGAEYCPYCGAENWALVVALSRFGRFTALGATESSSVDVFPRTQTFTFHGSRYVSPYFEFTPVETASNQLRNGRYATLEEPTAEEQGLMATFDRPPYAQAAGGIPFLDIANLHVLSGSQLYPGLLQGLSMAKIARLTRDPSSAVGGAIIGSANFLSAAICNATGNRPSSVCSSPGVVQARAASRGAR